MTQISFIKVLFAFPIIFYQNCVEPQGADCYTHDWNYQHKVVNCLGNWYIGEFGHSNKLTLQLSCPQDKKMRFSFTMGKFKTWDYEPFYVTINNVLVDQFSYDAYTGIHTNNLGYVILDPKSYTFTQQNGQTSTKISLQSSLDQDLNDESWGFRDVIIEILDPCVDFFSECDYQGNKFSICSKNSTPQSKKVPFFIKSFNMPDGITVKMKDSKYFGGELQTYTQNQTCLPDYHFQKYEKPV